MNDMHFESKFRRDREALKQVYFSWYFKDQLMIILYVAFSINFVGMILSLIFDTKDITEVLYPVIACAFLFLLLFIFCINSINIAEKRDNEISGGRGIDCVVVVSDKAIINSANGNRNELGFENVKKAFLTKDYIVIVSKAKWMYMLKKDSFTVGDAESFVEFLKSKEIKIRK